ncbi:hypothetical protein AB1Y20_000956 [Prymnesium parvum]|uniref:Light-harvesting complex protein n=1 Tax=Prymnesium parvum TaxID=97485 RepID=A0AB34K6U6_PRYPA|mmetsp:Transcript_47458/g.117484  ORF Transcript_47458/g.117484 Transcript_47458/m.117484 type:complete len:215 (+) Transcript_47458:62-706(+)
MLALVGATPTAFNLAPVLPQQQAARCSGLEMAISTPSKSMPFLTAPACQSSGLVGAEAGFDPLYLSDFMDIKWMREAELKHGRICMMATVGIIAQELFSLPGIAGYDPNPVTACSTVAPDVLIQVVGVMAWAEIFFNKGKFFTTNMFEDKSRVPGNVGFDPLKFGDNKAARERLELAELKNGRLAMLAFSGMIHQVFVTGKPVLASVGDIFAAP